MLSQLSDVLAVDPLGPVSQWDDEDEDLDDDDDFDEDLDDDVDEDPDDLDEEAMTA